MPRALWKGAISFGLVNVPVGLYPAASSGGLDFDWLDKRDLSPVGYKRVNKSTGREVAKENIVRGLEHSKGRYVVLSDEEIKSANVKATQTIDIVAFVDAAEVGPAWFDTPYFLAPDKRGAKVYALLRETLRREGKAGIAYVVLHTKQHLAMVRPEGKALMMVTLRWAQDMRAESDLDLPAAGLKGAGVRDNELRMASQLVKDMTEPWKPVQYKDQFQSDVMALVKRKAAKGQAKAVTEPEAEEPSAASNVVDLTALLKESLARGKRTPAKARAPPPAARKKAPPVRARKAKRKAA